MVRTCIHGEVAAYNADPGPLDAELLIAAAEGAIGLGMLRLRLDDRPVDLDELITPADHDELIAVLERSVVASGS